MTNKKPMMISMMMIMIISIIFAVQGFNMHQKVGVEEDKFHTLQEKYFLIDKTTRDSAQTNSNLNRDLVEIQNYPSELLRLKLVGVGRILVGIYVLLFGILMALIMMPIKLGQIIKNK